MLIDSSTAQDEIQSDAEIGSPTASKGGRKLWGNVIKFAITAASFAYLYFRFGRELASLPGIIARADLPYFALGVLAFFASQIVAVWRWEVCAKALSVWPDVTIAGKWRLIRMYFISSFWNNFLPGVFGGDLIRGVLLKRSSPNGGWLSCASSVIIDRACGLLMLFWIGAVAALAVHISIHPLPDILLWGSVALGATSAVAVALLFGFASFLRPVPLPDNSNGMQAVVMQKINDLIILLKLLSNNWQATISLALSSLVVQLLVSLCIYWLSTSLHVQIPWLLVMLLHPLSTCATLFLPSMNGLGVRESIYAEMFTLFGLSSTDGIAISISWLLVVLLVSLPGAVLGVKEKPIASEELTRA